MAEPEKLSMESYNKLSERDKGLVNALIMQGVLQSLERVEKNPASAEPLDLSIAIGAMAYDSGATETNAKDITKIAEANIEIQRAVIASDPSLMSELRTQLKDIGDDKLKILTDAADGMIAVDGDQFQVETMPALPTTPPVVPKVPRQLQPGQNIT